MRTLAWATIMFMSPFTSKGLIFIAPLVAVIAYTRWTVIIALLIVGSMVTVASADERKPMDLDTCMEHHGDVSEHYYQQGWRVLKSEYTGKISYWIKQKGNTQVHLICKDGLSIIETKKVDAKVNGEVDYQR